MYLFLPIVFVSLAIAQIPTPEGDSLFAKGDFAGAAREFKRITDANPEDGRAWFRLAASLNRIGKYEEAIQAFQAAIKYQFQAPFAMAGVARGYAALNQPDQAIDWLERSAKAGFGQLPFIDNDPGLAKLKADPRFIAAHQRIRMNSKPCTVAAEYQQFDFWLGEWDVEVAGQKVARSRIEKISDGCIVQENWMPSGGPPGKSWNFYNSITGKWEQVWVGGGGGVLKLEGEFKDGAMRYTGTTPARSGSPTMERLTFTPTADHGVHQFWEQSNDEGKTWTVAFDGIYRAHEGPAEQAMSADERRELLEHLKTSRKIFHDALQGVSAQQARFKPAQDRWSILECAEHITQAEKLLFADALSGLDLPPDGPKSRVTKENLLQAWGTSTVKAKSSGDYDPIGRWPDLESIEKVFDARRERSIDFVSETERDLRGRICCGSLDIWQQILGMSAHTIRHVQQINAVKADPAYPKG